MKTLVRSLFIAAVLGCLAAHAHADRLIILKGGRVFHGEVTASDAESVTVKRTDGEKEGETIKIPVDDCDPHFFYSVRDKDIGDDAKARIELAKYAVEEEMFSRAKAQMSRARADDPKVVEDFMKNDFPRIKEGLADKLLKAGERALKRGSTKNAKKYASAVLTKFADTKAVPGAKKLLDDIQAKLDAETAKKRKQRRRSEASDEARAERMAEAERHNMLEPVEKLIDQGAEANNRGLTADSDSKVDSAFKSAAAKYEHAVRQVDANLKTNPKDEDVVKALKEMRVTAVEGGVQAYLNLADSLAARGSYSGAKKACDDALKLDPNNADALAAKASISTADDGWSRRLDGRRRGGGVGRGGGGRRR
ncbi:MAG: tetratricopeptide repeat protein [Planctomycetota bacterium]|jgi:tetratricopeptide (TPR) repeat protein